MEPIRTKGQTLWNFSYSIMPLRYDPNATSLFQALLVAVAIGSVDLAEDFIKRWIGKDAQPQAFAAGLNIEILEKVIYFSTCQLNIHILRGVGEGWELPDREGGGVGRQVDKPFSLLESLNHRACSLRMTSLFL